MDITETSQSPPTCCLSGRFTFKDNDDFLKAIGEMGKYSGPELVLDLTGLDFIDSFALGLFLVASEMVEEAGKTLVVRNPQGSVRRLFRLSRLEQVLKIEESSPAIAPTAAPTAASSPALAPSRRGLDVSGPVNLAPGIISVELEGRFTYVDHAAFEKIAQMVTGAERTELQLGLSRLDFMDSAGLSMLLVVRDMLENQGGRMTLVSPRGKVMQLLRLASVDTVVSIIDAPKS